MIHNDQEEARRAHVVDVEGAVGEARLAKEEASILVERKNTSYSTDVKIT